MEVMMLQSILGEEISSISSEIAEKIESHIQSQDNSLTELKTKLTQLNASTEQSNFQLEKEFLNNQNKLIEAVQTGDALKEQLKDYEEKLNNARHKNEELQETHQKTVIEMQNLQSAVNQHNNEKIQLSDLLNKKESENQKSNELLESLNNQLLEANSSKHDFLVKAEDLEIKNLNIQHENRKLEQEKNLLEQQLSTLNNELSQKSQDILRLRKEMFSKVIELQAELDEKLEETQTAKDLASGLKKQLADKDRKLDNLSLKNKELQDNSIMMEQQFNQEIKALTKLRDLHKQNSDENQEKINELVKTIEEMHKLLKETGEANNQLEKSIGETHDEWQTKLEDKNEDIDRLNRELQTINELLTKSKDLGYTDEGLEITFPNAAATSKVLKSGMTLTEIYSELVKSQAEVQTERFEKQKLHQQLNQIIDEIEEKTPLFNKKLEEYQKAMETIACLRNQLGDSLETQERLQAERDDAVRNLGFLQRDNERSKNLISDLSLQVRNLLREIEEAKGGRIVDDEEMSTLNKSGDASSVITQRLVTFKDVKELQDKNQQLLAVVRDLSEQLDEIEKKNLETSTLELKSKLDEALKQLEELHEERKHQTVLVESIVRQKDLYKSMLSQYSIGQASDSFTASTPKSPGSVRKSPRSSQMTVEMAVENLKQLQEEFDNYRKEKQQDFTTVTNQLEKFRDELSESRIQNAKLNSELEYIREKFELAQSKADSYKKEVIIFREKSQKYSSSAIQHQQTISALRQDLISLQEKLAKSDLTVQNLQAERELLKATEIRLLQEKEAAVREQQGHTRLISNLQAVQNNLERMDSEAKQSMQRKIELLEQELTTARSKINSEIERYQAAVTAWTEKNDALQAKVMTEVGRSNKFNEDLVEAYAQLHQTKLEVATLQSKFSAAQNKLSRMPFGVGDGKGATTNEMRALQTQINDSKNEIIDLKQKLDSSQKSFEKYRNMANYLEKHMKEQNEASKQCKESLEKSLKEKEEEVNKLETLLKDTEQQNQNLKEEMAKLTNDRDQLIKNIDTLKHELDKSLSLVKQAQTIEQLAQTDKIEQAQLVAEAHENYQRELVLHSADVQELSSLREQVQGIRNDLLAAEKERDRMKESILANKESWNEQERLLKKEMEIMALKCQEMQSQNESLFQQLEVMSSQLATIKTSDWMKSDTNLGESSNTSTEHLMEVVRYLRKQKELALSQSEASITECSRYKMKIDILERKVAETEKELKEERDRANLVAASESQHRELLKKVEMLNLLSESNKLLRDEKDAAVQRNGIFESRVKQLESQLSPLQKSLQDSVSQMDVVNAECMALRQEVKKWQNRASQLLEQSRKHDPEDFKKLQEENSNLKTQLGSFTEEKMRLKAELSKQTSTIGELQKELGNLQTSSEQEKLKAKNLEQELLSSKNESAEHLRTTIQVKKIARKYKTEYTDLKTQFEDMTNKMNKSGETSAAQAAKEQQDILEMKKECEEKVTKANLEVEKFKEEVARLSKVDENAKAQEEKLRRLVLQAKKKINIISAERDNFVKDKTDTAKEVEELKSKIAALEQNSEEENLRASSFKSQLESKIMKKEQELKAMKDNKERLEKQVEDLSRQKQASRPSTSAGPVDRANSTISEPPLMANIRPLTPPIVGQGSLRHPPHSHQATSSARSTPTASIRPMAIPPSSSRTATVTPTTSTTMATLESDALPVTAHVLPTVPQATVQPTPAVVTNISTVTICPSTSSTIEQLSAEAASSMADSADAVSSVVSVSVVSTSPQTQVVTPTVKRQREEPEPQSSVITRETDSPDTTGSATPAPQIKRIRLVGETTLTVERASVVTSGTSLAIPIEPVPVVETTRQHQLETSTSSSSRDDHPSTTQPSKAQEEVRERPGVIVTPEPQTTPVAPESNINNQAAAEPETSVKEEIVTPVQAIPEPVAESETAFLDSQSSPDVGDQEEDESKKGFTEQEFVEEEEVDEEDQEVMDEGSYEEDQMPDAVYSQDDDDEDMVEDLNLRFDGDEEIADQNSDEGEIEEDSQMDAQEVLGLPPGSGHVISAGDAIPTSTSTQNDLPVTAMVTGNSNSNSGSSGAMTSNTSASNMPSSTDNPDILLPGTTQIHHRPPILPRVPPRSERIPSVSRQHLTPFSIPGQSGTFEDGDDSIVPSTPTLFVQSRIDGFAEAISSPQVPHGRFVFTNTSESGCQPGLSQLATQGALGVDDTRMDLSQFDEGSGRSVPTTPLQVSPPADGPGMSDLSDPIPSSQSSLKSQGGFPDQPVSSHSIPTITVTANEEDISLTIVQEDTVEGEGVPVIEESTVTIEEPKEEEILLGTSSETGPVITEIGLADEGVISDKESSSTTTLEPESGTSDSLGDSSISKGQPQRKPITWDASKGNAPGTVSQASTSTIPQATPLLPFPPPQASRPMEHPRGRRLRIRGAGASYSPRGSGQHGNWPSYRRSRGGRGPLA